MLRHVDPRRSESCIFDKRGHSIPVHRNIDRVAFHRSVPICWGVVAQSLQLCDMGQHGLLVKMWRSVPYCLLVVTLEPGWGPRQSVSLHVASADVVKPRGIPPQYHARRCRARRLGRREAIGPCLDSVKWVSMRPMPRTCLGWGTKIEFGKVGLDSSRIVLDCGK